MITYETKAFLSKDVIVSTVAVGLVDLGIAPGDIGRAKIIKLYVNPISNGIRVTWDGINAPTASFGLDLTRSSGFLVLEGSQNCRNLKMIRDGSVDVEVFLVLETELG